MAGYCPIEAREPEQKERTTQTTAPTELLGFYSSSLEKFRSRKERRFSQEFDAVPDGDADHD